MFALEKQTHLQQKQMRFILMLPLASAVPKILQTIEYGTYILYSPEDALFILAETHTQHTSQSYCHVTLEK